MKLRKKTGLAAGVLAAVTMLIAPAAFATNTLNVDGTAAPLGNVLVTGVNNGTLSFVTDFGVPASCTTSSVNGYVKRGSSVTAGQQLGAITGLTFGSAGTPCTATSLNYSVIIQKTATGTKSPAAPAEWGIFVTSTPAKGATSVPIEIRNVDAKMFSTTGIPRACDLRARGTVSGMFNQVNQVITISNPTSYPLDITAYDGSGTNTVSATDRTCGGQIYGTDFARMAGAFTLDTPGVAGIHW